MISFQGKPSVREKDNHARDREDSRHPTKVQFLLSPDAKL